MTLRFAANLSMLWTELDPVDRVAAAAACGFKNVEMQYPQAIDARSLRRALRRARAHLVLFNLDPGDRNAGERGLLHLPGRERDFLASVRDGLVLARWLGTRRLNVPAGNLPAGVDARVARSTAIQNLRHALPMAAAEGITLHVEPLNRIDRPGYALTSIAAGASLVRAIRSPWLRLQFDVYHAGMMGDPVRALRRSWPLIGHVQLADAPGRHEPGTGQLPIEGVLTELEARAYAGFVGLEYVPAHETAESLTWLAAWRHSAPRAHGAPARV